MDFIIKLFEKIMDFINIVTKKENLDFLVNNLQIATSLTIMFATLLKVKMRKKIKDEIRRTKFEINHDKLIRFALGFTVFLSAIKVVYLKVSPSFFLYSNIIVQYAFIEIMSGFNMKIYLEEIKLRIKLEELVSTELKTLQKKEKQIAELLKENDNLKETIKRIKGENNE